MNSESFYLNKFFDFLNEENIRYCVMNNYQNYPEYIPSDIDLAIDKATFLKLDSLIKDFSKKEQLPIIQRIWHGYQKCAYILSPIVIKEKFRLQLDFFVDFTAKGYFKLLSTDEMLSSIRNYKNFYIPALEVELIFLIMRRIIKNDATPEKIHEINDIYYCLSKKLESIQTLFGYEIKALVKDFLDIDDSHKLGNRNKFFSRRLKTISKQKSDLFYQFYYYKSEIKRLAHRLKNPVGFSVCFLSPDGGGKSTVLKNVAQLTGGSFHGDTQLYWRPRLLPPMGKLKIWNPSEEIDSNPDPHGHLPQSRIKSLIRFFYYLADYIGGYPVKVYLPKVRKKLVLFDRYYYDYLVDLYRYNMNISYLMPKMFLRIIPSLDVVIILKASPETMFKRKQEISISELKRQSDEYLKISKIVPNCFILNAEKDVTALSREVTEIILNKKQILTATAMKTTLQI